MSDFKSVPARKKYSSPQLTIFGEVRELTQSRSSGSFTESGCIPSDELRKCG